MDTEGGLEGSPARAAFRGGGALAAAHRGYAYQDLVAAYLLVRSLIERFDSVVVDRKAVDDDRFDDIEVTAAGMRIRRQLKSSEDASAALSHSDFNTARSSLRFDRLVNTLTGEGTEAADEYRLSVTWQPPAPTDPLAGLLVASTDTGTFSGFATRTFRLDPNAVWPPGGQPVFAPLQEPPVGTRALGRDEVVRFCQRFVVEVSLPPASLDLNAPGPLERLLLFLLSDRVGIGRYPNADRSAEDVAARAIYVASTARTAGATLRPSDVALGLRLRTDFGRVAQAFPLDRAVLQQRLPLRRRLRESILRGGVHLILAGPGSGKSWTLTQVAEDLKQEGLIVARHYCFLEPGDELVERRVTTDVFIGNLLGELSDAFRSSSLSSPQVFAAGLAELESYLDAAADADESVVIIVDGLDHIARVQEASSTLSDNETDIVERLATLSLPSNVTLVVGSQPGAHLQPLRDSTFGDRIVEHGVDAWTNEEVLDLAHSHGAHAAFESAHILEQERRDAILNLLVQRSEGNPLYTRYLTRGLTEGLVAGAILDPLDWLSTTPVIEGDIARYYNHLYASISHNAKVIADIVGVLEFSVTEAELRGIVGTALADWVPEALRVMSPVLSTATAQGGLRIFHESFRRFMLQELQRRGRSLSGVLSPVIAWLEARDFFADAKSYRFTLPVMRRAGREAEILHHVSATFVQKSLQHGHPHDAIERNLELAADVAARTMNWPALVRCAELSRALDACFDSHTNEWQEYWQTYEAIFGTQAMADRLLFDGRPTRPRDEGLLVCERVDIAGEAAPWREYLDLLRLTEDDEYRQEFDPFGGLRDEEEVGLAIIRGRLRLGQLFRIVRTVHYNLLKSDGTISSLFLRRLAKLLSTEVSPELVERLVEHVHFAPPKRYALPRSYACALLLGLADVAAEAGDSALASGRAAAALLHATSPEEAAWCIERGAPADRAVDHARPLASLNIAIEGERHTVDAPSVRRWVASVRLFAHDENATNVFADERRRLEGPGWYRCWLRFVIATAQAEAASVQGAPYDINAAFTELLVDARPFEGSPRACDLYSIQPQITDSLRRGLARLRTVDEWRQTVTAITDARSGTATRLDREDGGPITADAYFSILLAHTSSPIASTLISETLERGLIDEEENGTYYSNHAFYRLRLARLHAKLLQRERALEHWREASIFMLGYGFHKDIALFDIIDSAPVLAQKSELTALGAIERLQPLLSAVLRHTDRRETKGTPNAWFRALLKINPVRAIELLSREFGRELGQMSWIAERAQQDMLRELRDSADPLLLNALWETLLLEIEYENGGADVADDRLHPIGRLLTTHPEYARERFINLCASVFDDARHYRTSAVARLDAFARNHGLTVPWATPVKEQEREAFGRGSSGEASSPVQPVQTPAFPPSPRFVEILTSLRRLSQAQLPSESLGVLVAQPLSYLITEMVDRGEEAQAQRLLRFLVHEVPFWSYEREHPIAPLARSLDDAGHARLAAAALTLSFTASRGGGGYLNFGDRSHATALKRAMELDRELALQTLAEETARKLRLGGFSGIARHLVEQISDWGDHEVAAQAWEEAFAVLSSRLPLPAPVPVLEPFDVNDTVTWSVDEALATLLLSRIGNASLPRKIAALAAFTRLLQELPDLFPGPIEWLLTRDATVSTAQTVMQILIDAPGDPTRYAAPLEQLLQAYVRSDAWTLSWLAEQLLDRAGRPYATTRSRPRVAVAAPSAESIGLIQFADAGGALEDLEDLWPDLPVIVAHRMGQLMIGNDDFKYYAKERYELTFSRVRDTVSAAVVSWPVELQIAVLDEALMGLHEFAWRRGLWGPQLEDQVAARVLPDTHVHLGLYASRVPRPDWSLANEAKNQLGDLVRVPDEDPIYRGWVRLALYEQSLYNSESRDYLDPDRSALRSAAIVLAEIDGTVPKDALPLPEDYVDRWWSGNSAREASLDSQRPQPVRLGSIRDWLGTDLALVPPIALRRLARLQPPAYGAPLRWHDVKGDPAVVLRNWRVRGRNSDTEAHTILGCDLLLRPDLLKVLERAYSGGPFKELQRIRLRDLKRRSH